MADFKRPENSFYFDFQGVNTRDVADAIPPNKYQFAVNVRSTGSNSVRTRPGYLPLFSGNNAITDIRGYASLNTDSLPRLLARDSAGAIWLDDGVNVGNLAAPAGYGASMLPFRPSESPQAWMYIGAQGDYQKFSAPGNNNAVTQYKVGIAEPQQTLQAAPGLLPFTLFNNDAAHWTPGGTAGSTSDGNRSLDTFGSCIADPALSTRFYCQVGNNANSAYSTGETLFVNNNFTAVVQDVFPAIPGNLAIQAIRYDSGSNGNCTIVPSQIPIVGNQTFDPIAGLRRGSLIQLGGSETVLVQAVIPGPNGRQAILTSTNNTWLANNSIAGVPSIAINGGVAISAGQSAVALFIGANMNNGVATFTESLNSNPFVAPMAAGVFPQQDDYIHLSVAFGDPSQLVQMLVMFDLDAGGNNFNGNVLYYAVRPSDLVTVTGGNQTLISTILEAAENEIIGDLPTPGNITPPAQSSAGNNQWAEILFPISSLTRLGGDETRTLANATGVQLQVNVSNNTSIRFGSFWVGGGSAPDVGNNGAPYAYQAVPLSSLTGVRGNPTPLMRYGVSPRRQSVIVKTSNLNASYDPQIDTWEVFRYGGSITSYRFLGTVPAGSDFNDVYFDDTDESGDAIVIDNTEPWPSIDVPWRATSNNANISAVGTILTVTGAVFPSTINRWLPGTLFQIGNNDAYTLRKRPVASGNNSYVFEFEECIGAGNQNSVFVLEPNVARQTLPYLWGPNEQGYFFGCGDPLRPGVVSWCKSNAPDAVPTAYNLELCPPSEPLLGGAVIGGISLVASSARWWALYFQQGTPLYNPVEVQVGRRLASPFGHCGDGKVMYFWASDCIAMTGGAAAVSLTDADLYNLFPHGGEAGKNVTRGTVTFYAPDYSQAATFRIAVREGIIYATYRDSTSAPRMMIGEIKQDGPVAWSTDVYPLAMTAPYAIEQPEGSLEFAPQLYPAVVMGSANGNVVKIQDYTNDGGNSGTPITAQVGTFEWNAGDLRMGELWGDMYLDCVAPNGLSAQPISQSIAVPGVSPTVLASNNSRQFAVVSLAGGQLINFGGLNISWTDDFSAHPDHTRLHAWQPSIAEQVETITDRVADWTNCGTEQNKFLQGIILDADTFNATKKLVIQDADTMALHALQPAIIHNGQQGIPYSFVTPFLAHLVRDVPQDMVAWRKFGITYIFEPTPESVETWTTQWTALGGKGYKHIPRIEASYSSTAKVTLTITSYDGVSPTVLTLPSTSGVTEKLLLTLTLNKGQLYKFSATSPARLQIFWNDFIIWVGEWGRKSGMRAYRNLGGEFGDSARI